MRPIKAETILSSGTDTDSEEKIFVDWMNVGRDTWNLKLAENCWISRIREINCPERIDVSECDKVTNFTNKTSTPDTFTTGDIIDFTNCLKNAVTNIL